MRKITIGAAAFVATVLTAIPASAHDPYDYPYCLQGRAYGYPGLCYFTSYEQCQAAASGTVSFCGTNPRFAYGSHRSQPRGRRPYQVPTFRSRAEHVRSSPGISDINLFRYSAHPPTPFSGCIGRANEMIEQEGHSVDGTLLFLWRSRRDSNPR